MPTLENWIISTINNEKPLPIVIVLILVGFSLRAYRMQHGTVLLCPETAGKRVLLLIAGMVILSFCYNSKELGLPEDTRENMRLFAIFAYIIIAAASPLKRQAIYGTLLFQL